MAAEDFFNKPSNRVVQNDFGGPIFAQIGANATLAQMVPGRFVTYDTSGNSTIKEATDPSGNIGILGFEDTQPIANQPADRDTAYGALYTKVAVHNTIGMRFRGWLATGQTVYPGTILKITANGTVTPITLATDQRNAKALETVTSSGVTACWMQYLG